MYNSAPQVINNSIIYLTQYGIYGEANGKSPLIKNNIINRTPNPEYSYAGIYFSNGTNSLITVNDISGFNYGLYLSGGGYSTFADENYDTPDINNRFRNNNYGIGAANSSRIFAGSPFIISTYCFNGIYDNLYYDAEAHTNGIIYSQSNWWGSDRPRILTYSGGYIDANNPLDYDPWEQIPDNMSIGEGFSRDNPRIDSLLIGFILEREGDIAGAVRHYKQFITNNSHPRFALARLVDLKNKYQVENIKEYLVTLLAGNRPYKPVILTLLAGILLNEDKYDQAMLLYDQIIGIYPNTYHSVNALFEKFFATLHHENNLVLAATLLQELENLNLEDDEYLTRLSIAQDHYNSMTEFLGKSNNQNMEQTQTGLPKEYELLGNYPNPFNPSTTISYLLPYISQVELKIYDIMGREIKSFNIASQTPGRQTLTWDGTNRNGVPVSSGVYLYRITMKSLENYETFVKTSKLMLLK